ncbi:hypothetical protein ACED96_10000 [Clostridium thermobutyricum]
MKLNNFFNKNKLIKISLISFILSILLFFTAMIYIGNSNYKLSKFSKEIEETFGVDFNEIFSFNYFFASTNEGVHRNISLNNLDKLIIKSPNSYIVVNENSDKNSYLAENNTFSTNIDVRKLNKVDTSKYFNYQYLEKTKTGIITLNDKMEGIFYSSIYLDIPSKFKGSIVLETFEENVNNITSSLNVSVNQPK